MHVNHSKLVSNSKIEEKKKKVTPFSKVELFQFLEEFQVFFFSCLRTFGFVDGEVILIRPGNPAHQCT